MKNERQRYLNVVFYSAAGRCFNFLPCAATQWHRQRSAAEWGKRRGGDKKKMKEREFKRSSWKCYTTRHNFTT